RECRLGYERYRILEASRRSKRVVERSNGYCTHDRQLEGGKHDLRLRRIEVRLPCGDCARADALDGGEIELPRLGLRRRYFEQPMLVSPIGGEKRKRLDRIFRRVEVRDVPGFQRSIDLATIDRPEPCAEYGLGRASRDGRDGTRRIGGAGRGTRDVKREHGIDVL